MVAINAQEMHAQFPRRKSTTFAHGQDYLEIVSFPGAVTSDYAREVGNQHGAATGHLCHLLEEMTGQGKVRYWLN